jgi:hypothetical protein
MQRNVCCWRICMDRPRVDAFRSRETFYSLVNPVHQHLDELYTQARVQHGVLYAPPDATSADRSAGVRYMYIRGRSRSPTTRSRASRGKESEAWGAVVGSFPRHRPASNTSGSCCGLAATSPSKVAKERFRLFLTCLK